MNTPGPWELGSAGMQGEPPYVNIYQGGDALFIGSVSAEEVPTDVAESNARLVAAAPDLLEACQQAFQHLNAVDDTGRDAEALLRYAIAKAKGAQ